MSRYWSLHATRVIQYEIPTGITWCAKSMFESEYQCLVCSGCILSGQMFQKSILMQYFLILEIGWGALPSHDGATTE